MFAENQFKTKNNHENLEPLESARVIIDHVKTGKVIAENTGLPVKRAEVGRIDFLHDTAEIRIYFDEPAAAVPTEVEEREPYLLRFL